MPAEITKYGISGLKGLKGINQKSATNNLPTWEEMDIVDKAYATGRTGPTVGKTWTTQSYGADTPMGQWGISKYDSSILNAPMTQGDIDDTRYENQPWYDTLANGVGKMLGTAGTTFVSSLIGLPYGIGAAINEGRWSALWDNEVTQGLSDVDKWLEENMTNYRSQVQQNSPWYDPNNLFSMNFIADDIIKNMGFTLGAAASMAVGSGSLGLLSKSLGVVNKVSKTGRVASNVLSSLFSATGEGMIEAKQGVDERNKLEFQRLEDALIPEKEALRMEFNTINQEYAANRGKNVVMIDGIPHDLAYDTYESKMKDLAAKRDALKRKEEIGRQQIIESGQEMGNMILGANQVLLTVGNLIQFSKGMTKSFDKARHAAGQSIKYAKPTLTSASRVSRNIKDGYKVSSPWPGRVTAATKGILTEGSEEMNQEWIRQSAGYAFNEGEGEAVNDYWRAKLDPESYRETTKGLYTVGNILDRGFQESWGDLDQWEQFIVGGLTGMSGSYMPSKIFNQDKTKSRWNPARYGSWEGGAYNEVRDFNRDYRQYKENIEDVNRILASKDFPARVGSLVGHTYTEKEKEYLAEENDKKGWKDADDKQAIHDIQAFLRAGKLDDLRAIYNEMNTPLSDEDVESLVKATTREISAEEDKKNFDKSIDEQIAEHQRNISKLQEKAQDIADQQDVLAPEERGGYQVAVTPALEGIFADIDKEWDAINNLNLKKESYTGQKKYHGAYVDENGNRTATNDEIRAEHKHNSEELNRKLNSYLDSIDVVNKMTNGQLTKDQEDNLAYLHNLSREKITRFNKIMANVRKQLPNKFVIKTSKTPEQLAQENASSDFTFAKNENTPEGYVEVDTSLMNDKAFGNFFMNTVMYGDNIVPEESQKEEEKKTTEQEKKEKQAEQDIEEQRRMNIKRYKDNFYNTMRQNTDMTLEEIRDAFETLKQDIYDASVLQYESQEFWNTYMDYMTNPQKVDKDKEKEEKRVSEEQQKKDVQQMSVRELAQRADLKDLLVQAKADSDIPMINKIKKAMLIRQQKAQTSSAGRDSSVLSAYSPEDKDMAIQAQMAKLDQELDRMDDDNEKESSLQEMADKIKGVDMQTVDDIILANLNPVDKARLMQLEQDDPEAFEKEMAERENRVLQALDELETRTMQNLPDFDETRVEISDKDLADLADKIDEENPKGPAQPKRHDEVNPVISVPVFSSEAPTGTNSSNDSVSDASVLDQDMKQGMDGVPFERSGQHPWRAVTRRVGYKTNEPYSQTLERILSETTDETKRKQLQKQLQRVKAVEKVLDEQSAFSRVEQGKVSRGAVIRFAVSKAVNDEAGDFVIFMTDINGNVLADLPSSDIDIEPNTNQIPGLADLYEEARRQWDNLSDEEKDANEFIPLKGLQTKIDYSYFGKVLYQDERHSVNELFGDEGFTLALRVGERNSSDPQSFIDTGKKSLAGKTERQAIREPLTGTKGQPYVLIPTSKAKSNTYGEGYLAVPILTPSFSELSHDSQFYRVVKDVLERIRDGKIENKQAKELLQVLFGVDNVHVNFDGDQSKKGSGITVTTFTRANQSEKGNPHDIFKGNREGLDVDAALEALGRFFVNISNKKINTSETFYTLPNGEKISYNRMIGEIATTNAAMPHTVNDFFTVVPLENKEGKFEQVSQKPPRMKFPQGNLNSVFHVKVKYKDGTQKMWSIDPSENFVCRDEQGRPIYKEDNVHTASEKKLAAQYRAEAFGRFYMKDFSKPFAVMIDNKAYLYDPINKTFKTVQELEKTAPRYNKNLQEYDRLEDMLQSMAEAQAEADAARISAEEVEAAVDGTNKEEESLRKEGDSILRKLGYKSKDRHPNGHVRGGQSGWKLRFIVKNPATGKAFTQEEVNADKNAYLNTALPLLNWLKDYFSNPDGSDTISTSKPQSDYDGYAAHYHFTDKDGHSREPFKFLTGGEVGEADFTIYIGSIEDVEKFMSDVENSPINDALAVGNNNKSDVDFNGKIHGRIEGSSIGFSGYMLPDGLNKMLPESTTVYKDDRIRIFIFEKEYIVEDKKEGKFVVINYAVKATPGSAREYINNNILHIRNTIARNVYGDYIAQDNNKENKKTEKEKTIKRVESTVTKLQDDGVTYVVCDVNGNPNPNGNYYKDEKGVLYARVTSMAEGDPQVEPFRDTLEDGTENPWILPSTTIGNQVDEFIRVFFEGGDPMSLSTPNLSQKSKEKLLEDLDKIKEQISKQGWKVASRNVVASGILGVTDANGDQIIVRVAGTLDLLLYNPEKDKYAIYDIKTHRAAIDFNNVENDSHMGKWSAQLSLYKEMLEAKYPELRGKIKGLKILPIKVSSDSYDADKHKYSMGNGVLVDENKNAVSAEIAYDGQTIPVKERSLNINMGKKGFKTEYNEEGKKQIIVSKPRALPGEDSKQKVKEGLLQTINKIAADRPVQRYLKDAYKDNPEAIALSATIDEARKNGTLADLMLTEATMNMLSDMLNEKLINNHAAQRGMNLEGLQIPGENNLPKGAMPEVAESESTDAPTENVEEKARKRKLLNPTTERAWNKLTEENKRKAVDAANVVQIHKALQDAQRNPRKNPNQLISPYLHRKAVDTRGYKKLDINKELEWLNKVLPQLSRLNKVRIIQGLIRCSDGTWDYGQLRNGLMYLGTNGKEGTVYHEAFHAVTQWILTDKELDDLYEAARERYGNLDTVTLEEKLADDFMQYTMGVRPMYKPKHQGIFKTLWNAIKKMFGHTSMIDKLYQNINDGVYAEAVLRMGENEFADIKSEDREASMQYQFLDKEQRDKLKEGGVSKDQYEVLDSNEKRYLFHCVL